MNVFEKIKTVCNARNIPAYPDVYTGGDLTRWATYTLTDREPVSFGDNYNVYWIDYVTVNVFLPMSENYFDEMKQLSADFIAAGFTAPSCMTNFDADQKIRQLTFSCSAQEE